MQARKMPQLLLSSPFCTQQKSPISNQTKETDSYKKQDSVTQ